MDSERCRITAASLISFRDKKSYYINTQVYEGENQKKEKQDRIINAAIAVL